jgi:2'-5' RNA ligase
VRLFVAIDLAPSIVRSLSEMRNELEPHTSKLRWVRSESLHLTLKFLGEASPRPLGAIEDRLGRIRGAAFKVSVSGVGFFPNIKAPRMLWAGVSSKAVEQLAADVDKQMVELDFPPERRKFTPHLTLARSRGNGHINPELVQAVERIRNSEFGDFTADRFHLCESRLHPSGAVYKKLGDYRLE